jgi:hypothetical protein
MIDVRLSWVCMECGDAMRHAASAILKLTTNGPTGVLEPQVSFSNTPQQDLFLSNRFLLSLFVKFHVEFSGVLLFSTPQVQ